MQPKDLPPPFTSFAPRPLWQHGVLYLPYPLQAAAGEIPPWEELFARSQPTCIEYCSGNGDWVVEQAATYPQVNWVAVERRFDRVRKIWAKAANRGVKNLLIVCGEAFGATRFAFPSQAARRLYLNFPDPWPKRRHAKYRLIQREFIQEGERLLDAGGEFVLATDHEETMLSFIRLMQSTAFQPCLALPGYVQEWPGYGHSWFDQLWRQQGKGIFYTVFRLGHDLACDRVIEEAPLKSQAEERLPLLHPSLIDQPAHLLLSTGGLL